MLGCGERCRKVSGEVWGRVGKRVEMWGEMSGSVGKV